MLGLGFGVTKGGFVSSLARTLYRKYVVRVTAAGGVFQNAVCALNGLLSLNSKGFLKDASWVLIPDGIKEDIVFAEKPTDGIGDLAFTRASDATYTDSTGVVRRSPYNLASWSEMFSDASWSKTGITVTPNVALAPNGTMTADRIQFSSSNQALSQTTSLGTGVVCTASFYVLGTAGQTLLFAAGGLDQLVTLTGSWQRISTTKTSINSTLNVSTFGGATARDIFLWGAQLVEGTSALDYFPTTNRQDVPRIDFRNADGTLSSCGRLLLEPQRTNGIRNSSMVGAVAGSPGTLPTNWSQFFGTGLTRTVVGIGTENGLPYIDVRFNGTVTTTSTEIVTETSNAISVLNGQVWSTSTFFKIVTAPTPPNSYTLKSYYWNGGAYVNESNTSFTPTTTLARYSAAHTVPAGTITHISQAVRMNLTNGAAYDFTVRIAAPQMELGGFATTWVPTTTAAVTRIADATERQGATPVIGPSEGTLFIDVNLDSRLNTSDVGVTSTASSLNNRIGFSFRASNINADVVVGGVAQAGLSFVNSSTGRFKLAIGYKANDIVYYANGTLVGTDTSATIPVLNDIVLYNSTFGQTQVVKYNQAVLMPTRLTNAQLEALTSDGYDTYALLAQSLNCILQ